MVFGRARVGARLLTRTGMLIGAGEGKVTDGAGVTQARIDRVQSCRFLDLGVDLRLADHSTTSLLLGWVISL